MKSVFIFHETETNFKDVGKNIVALTSVEIRPDQTKPNQTKPNQKCSFPSTSQPPPTAQY